ncbi:hypothetical protein VCRA2114E365_130121 [Vibrio crassostreae]|nr:hypothetical protein VCHA53O468_140027 [Vibrio chagasii]CAK1731604.1 hypothetical protein VCRA2115O371_120027 [Vibrio crassostreae]CAH7392243.1 hypothetical protein VCHA43P273_60228 [Vibrio chagasii]CAK1745155.1 hypothetical protein VCRA2114O367_130028 [Vibrio crassostreae]CAK1746737.1 hypothetical protein VCRA2117O376_130027 [Vibrio crassostreae]
MSAFAVLVRLRIPLLAILRAFLAKNLAELRFWFDSFNSDGENEPSWRGLLVR